jgi:UDP-N-acetylglucosamine acyltransferase
MSRIHPSAVIDPRAELDADVEVGAFSVIGADTRIGSGTVIGPHVVIDGHTVVGRNNRFHPFASIGGPPQDKKYRGEPTSLVIGDGNTFRESVTVNRGTVQDAGVTRIGSDNWVMAYVHIAHDCNIGNHTIFANSTNLAGHVQVGDWAILGGCTQVHQFCKIGAHAMTGAGTVVLHDIPPFVMTSGNSASAHGLNSEGLKRRGFSPSRLQVLRSAYKLLYKAGLTLDEARAALQRLEAESAPDCAADLALLNGFLTRVTRGIVR